ncbi:MAG: NAD-dependent epimerase/dehydratase family protein [Deltaproteobacteria bacterium]|nr:NAD-dependent epimerase/dehydratase family protein [Deltaproteobacteria bacterium]
MAKTLIIGGGGFIGGHLAYALVQEGEQVDIVDDFSRAIRDPFLQEIERIESVNIIDADISASSAPSELSNDYRVIYQLAAIIGVRHVLERPYEVLHKNVVIQAQAIELAKRQKALDHFIFSSTSEIYAGSLKHMEMPIPTPEHVPIALSELDHPRTSYMLSKIYGEAMCQQSGLPFTIVRPHNVYGPRMGLAHVLPELMKKARSLPKNGNLEVASVNHRRAFCYIDDAIKIMRSLASHTQAIGGTYNLGNQKQEITIGEFARLVLEVTDRTDLKIVPLPETPGSPARRCPDMTRTHHVIGHPPFIDLKEGIEETYKWYAKNVFSEGGVSAI